MGFFKSVTAIIFALVAVTIYFRTKQLFEFTKKPSVEDIWWGPGEPSKANTNIRPFKVNISEEVSMIL